MIGGEHRMRKSVLGYFVMRLDNPKPVDFNPGSDSEVLLDLDVSQHCCLTPFFHGKCRTPLWSVDSVHLV